MSEASNLAVVLLSRAASPDLQAWGQAVRQHHAEAPAFQQGNRREQLVTAEWGGDTVAATTVPQPLDWERLAGPCDCAWYWPEAESTLRGHTAQLLVHLVSNARDPVERALRLTRLVSAAATVCPALGVLWAPAGLVHAVEPFQQLAAGATRDLLPLHLWIDFRIESSEPGSLRLFTTGMELLGHREIEVRQFHGPPRELMDAVYNVAHYVIDKVKPLSDGDTLSVNDFQEVVIRHGESMLDQATPVYELEF